MLWDHASGSGTGSRFERLKLLGGRRFPGAGAFLVWSLLRGVSSADVGLPPVSSDFDAEFARAADLLEGGERERGEAVLSEIRRLASRPAWDARAAFLLALDDERRRAFDQAAARLRTAPAGSIGLEPFRLLLRARNQAAAGNVQAALSDLEELERREEPFAGRTDAARFTASLFERIGDRERAAAALARAAAAVPSESVALAPERIRLALATGDRVTVAAASRDLLLGSPGADVSRETPAPVRSALRLMASRLSAADRARRGRALIAAGDPKRGVALLERTPASRWPAEERSLNLLALARGQGRLGRTAAALRTLEFVTLDSSVTSFEAGLLRADLILASRSFPRSGPLRPSDPRVTRVRRLLLALTVPAAPPPVRTGARERLIRLSARAEDFAGGLEEARRLVSERPGTRAGFEPLWLMAWERYRLGDRRLARNRFEDLASVFGRFEGSRRLSYWIARCLEGEGRRAEAASLYRALAAVHPPDLYARFARQRVGDDRPSRGAPLPDPSTATATFRRADELLRLRLFSEAAAEARSLPASRGRDLRLAQAEFALGRFVEATSAARRAFPQLGTVEEGRVPDGWRRLYYPIENGGFLGERAREFRLDPAVLRGLVRQESVFDSDAKSRAGALGLTQLMPSTAESVARSVLRVRYRRAFLYDPGVNARLGAAYLARLYDRFGHNAVFALAAYNGGPTRMARVLRSNPRLREDELFESHPAFESRDYVRRVLLFAESYRELYP